MARIFRERFKTKNDVFDSFTERTLFELGCRFSFESEQLSPVSIGKEANVFSVKAKPMKLAVKVYRLEVCDFNRMYNYIRTDPRFTGLQSQRRKVIFAWAQREYRNLLKAREAQVSAPTPIGFLNNVLVMEFIGSGSAAGPAAPMLKDATPDDAEGFFRETVLLVKRLYRAGMVHGDLSHFNILNYKGRPVLIDFSQATELKDPLAQERLMRDIKNICSFFKKLGVDAGEDDVLRRIRQQ